MFGSHGGTSPSLRSGAAGRVLQLRLQTTCHFGLNLQGPPLEFTEASPPRLEQRALWKGLNSALSQTPEVSLLAWVHTIPSPAHSLPHPPHPPTPAQVRLSMEAETNQLNKRRGLRRKG